MCIIVHYPCWGKPGHVKDTGHMKSGDKLVFLSDIAAGVGAHRCGPTRPSPTP